MTRYYFTTAEEGDGYQVLDKVSINPEYFKNNSLVFFVNAEVLEIDQDKIVYFEYPIYNGNVLEVTDEDGDKQVVLYENINEEYAYYNVFESLDGLKIKKAEHIIYNGSNKQVFDMTKDIIKLYNKYLNE